MLVEGHGEVAAAGNLVTRLWQDAGRWQPWAPPRRWKNLHQRKGIEDGVRRTSAEPDVGALLILRDEDDACPKECAPLTASWVRQLAPPSPVAIVLLHREYEVLFLPCVEKMSGQPIVGVDGQRRPGIRPGTKYTGGWEARRGVKEWISDQFPPGRAYKPTLDQLPMTRMIDIPTLRGADVPCSGSLERALEFLAGEFGRSGVYPRALV